MNIFVLDLDFTKCAEYHCDKHVVKMILEHVQLLSSCCRYFGSDMGYQMTHVNHPCSVWLRQSLDNWNWLYDLTSCLNSEYKFRYEKRQNHKSYDVLKTLLPPEGLESIGLTPFALAMPNDVKIENNPVMSYRNYYKTHKINIVTWKRRPIPEWMNLNAEHENSRQVDRPSMFTLLDVPNLIP